VSCKRFRITIFVEVAGLKSSQRATAVERDECKHLLSMIERYRDSVMAMITA
jgi:hypothetical protein